MNTEIANSISTFSSYQRKQSIENHYGSPIFDIWDLSKRAKSDKESIVVTFHLICYAAGKNIFFANRNINRYTLALYKVRDLGKYTDETINTLVEYSQPNVYGWVYGTNPCGEKNLPLRIKKVSSILESEWAAVVIDNLGTTADEVQNKLKTLAKGGIAKYIS